MSNEVKPAAQSIAEARKRTPKPGMQRVMVSITSARATQLEQYAKNESPVFQRPINETLSVLIEKQFDHLIGGTDAK